MPEWFFSFPENFSINIVDPIDNGINYMLLNWADFFNGLKALLNTILDAVGTVVNIIPWWLLILAIFFATWRMSKKVTRALLYSALMLFIGALGLWDFMYQTLATVITAVLISLIIGFPLGIVNASSKLAYKIGRPILDTMQTMPSFVYLIPAVMLLGLGNVPAVIATTIYAVPPIIRLTTLGIQQVDTEIVEAAKSFGSTKWQLLMKVEIPQALPTIMTGVNQTIMMAIAMIVTCSLIGATGLGQEVIIGINRLQSGRGFAAGIAIVIIAIIMDRLTQGIFKKKEQVKS